MNSRISLDRINKINSIKIKFWKFILTVILTGVYLFVCGCQPGAVGDDDKIVCPGKTSIEEAIRVLQLQKQNLQPFQASAKCVISYPDEDGQLRDEPVRDGRIAFVPDEKIFFRGQLVFKELRFGTNQAEFWLRIKAEFEDFGDSYWWGRREDLVRCPEMLPINPDNIAEALGIVEVSPNWELSNQEGYDVLTLVEDGRIQKRVCVNACDYSIKEIDYFDSDGLKRVSVQLKDYSAKENGILVPTWIKFVSYDRFGALNLAVLFEFKDIQLLPPEKIGKKLFSRPARDGFGHLYRLNENCEFVEE